MMTYMLTLDPFAHHDNVLRFWDSVMTCDRAQHQGGR